MPRAGPAAVFGAVVESVVGMAAWTSRMLGFKFAVCCRAKHFQMVVTCCEINAKNKKDVV